MKCPKCGYLGFDQVDRCRNCGYDFSLTTPSPVVELPLRTEQAERQASDLGFIPDREPGRGTTIEEPVELPLFGGPILDDEPLIKTAPPPRPPLAVRRATPEIPRLRSPEPRLQSLDLDDPLPPPRAARPVVPSSIADHEPPVARAEQAPAEDAGLAARFVAVAIDVGILGLIDALVLYLTMQICGIGPEDLRILPRAPLVAFLILQNGGYLVAFTAGGQTIGKLAAGIKVVSADARESVDLGRAFIRELLWLGLAVPAGLGLLSILSRDHRGIHDRFAGTRVVRVG